MVRVAKGDIGVAGATAGFEQVLPFVNFFGTSRPVSATRILTKQSGGTEKKELKRGVPTCGLWAMSKRVGTPRSTLELALTRRRGAIASPTWGGKSEMSFLDGVQVD